MMKQALDYEKLTSPLKVALGRLIVKPLTEAPPPIRSAVQAARIVAKASPKERVPFGAPINDCEYRVFSQHGEDGILARIFDEIGFRTKVFVEFGFSTAECNALHLVKRDGFTGVWIDADGDTCCTAKGTARLMRWDGIQIANCFVDPSNINDVIGDNVPRTPQGSIDMLSVDIDGIDYWVLQAITIVRPRVLVCEYNAVFGPERAVSVPYSPSFRRFEFHSDGLYFGASLKALECLAGGMGYRLVGTDKSGTNAFFLDEHVRAPHLITQRAADCWRPMRYWTRQGCTMEEKFNELTHLDLVEI